MSTFDRVVKVLGEYGDFEGKTLTPETTFEEIGLDSLSVVEAVMGCEEEFGVEIEITDNPKTIGDFVALVDSLLG